MKTKKLMSLLLVSAMSVGLLAGCGNNGDKQNDGDAADSQQSSDAVLETSQTDEKKNYWEMLDDVSDTSELPDWAGEVLDVTIWVAGGTDWVSGAISEDNVTFKELERVTGIRFNLDDSYGNEGETIDAKMPKMIAGKDFPTMVFSWNTNAQMKDLYENGYLKDLTSYYEDGTLAHVQTYIPTDVFGDSFMSSMRGEDGSYFMIPESLSLNLMAPYWDEAGYVAPGYDSEYFYTYVKSVNTTNNSPYSTAVAVRDDILQALYPDALTKEEIEKIWVEEGAFTEDQIFDIGLESTEDFYQLLYDIQELLKSGDYVGADGKTMEVTFGPNSEADNWDWLKNLPSHISPQARETNYFSVLDVNETDSTKLIKSAWETDYYQEFIKDLNTLVNDDVIAQNSLVDDAATFTEKVQNGHYAVYYGQTASPWDISDPDGEWSYRPVWIKQAVGTDYNTAEAGYPAGYWGIFSDSVTDEQLEQLLHAIDYLWSDVGTKNFVWGPASAGLFEEDENGVRHYTDAEVEACMLYGEDNESGWKYGLFGYSGSTSSTKIDYRSMPIGVGVYLNSAKYLMAEEMPRSATGAYAKFIPGILGGEWSTANNSVTVLATNYNLHSYGVSNVEGLKTFWSARSGFENQLKKVVAATPDNFDKEMENLKEYCVENGWTDEAMLEFNEKFVEANEKELRNAGYID